MEELRKEITALVEIVGAFVDDSIKALDRVVSTIESLIEAELIEDDEPDRCTWRRAQVRSSHGELSNYGRRCIGMAAHPGMHCLPKAAKQSTAGVWFDPATGYTVTQ